MTLISTYPPGPPPGEHHGRGRTLPAEPPHRQDDEDGGCQVRLCSGQAQGG